MRTLAQQCQSRSALLQWILHPLDLVVSHLESEWEGVRVQGRGNEREREREREREKEREREREREGARERGYEVKPEICLRLFVAAQINPQLS